MSWATGLVASLLTTNTNEKSGRGKKKTKVEDSSFNSPLSQSRLLKQFLEHEKVEVE